MNPHQKKSNKNSKNPKSNNSFNHNSNNPNQNSQASSKDNSSQDSTLNKNTNLQNKSAENIDITTKIIEKNELENNQILNQIPKENLDKSDKPDSEKSQNTVFDKLTNLKSSPKINPDDKKIETNAKTFKTTLNNSPLLYGKIMATFFLGLIIFGTVFVNGYVIPEVILGQTDGAIAAKTKKESEEKKTKEITEKRAKLELENKKLSFMNQKIAINIKDFGSIKIDLKENAAPKTVENFVRLTNRGYFNGTVFHRMVKSPTFSVIQGGDPTATGTGGETASGEPLVDEVWKVKPQSDPQNPGKFLNTPEFTDPSLYKNFDLKTGQVTYPKGQILMAKTSAPDSASSQFFITLTDTVLPAEYTIFGVLQSESFAVLDKISKEIDPISSEAQQSPEYKDGKPNKELKIESAVIL